MSKLLKMSSILLGFLGLVQGLMAQSTPMSCTASVPVAPNVRQEGIAELAGDILITCTGGTPIAAGQALPTYSLAMFLSTSVTSRVLVATTPPLIETLLFVDDPAPQVQSACVTTPCNLNDNVFQAQSIQFNSVNWNAVPINPPGPNGQRILRIKNLRVNASQLPVNTSVLAFISLTGPNLNSLNGAQQTIAYTKQGFVMEQRNLTDTAAVAPSFVACTGNNVDLATSNSAQYSTNGGRSFLLKFSEPSGFAAAWKRRNAATTVAAPTALGQQDSPSVSYGTESGYYSANLPLTNNLRSSGLADSGTRLRVQFSNIPAGVRIYVTTREVLTGSTVIGSTTTTHAVLTSNPGAFSPLTPDSTADNGLKLVGPSGEAVWEIMDTDTGNSETVAFGVVVAFTSNPQPAAGTISVSGSFAPASTVTFASPSESVPRFSIPSPPVLNTAFTLNACHTTLLFQFLTNQAGFDTGVAISNTTKDTINTQPQTGRCVATFFPTPASSSPQYPPLNTNGSLAAGEQWTFNISSQRPGFQGYMIVGCDFQFAHGYAFISDFGSQKLAQGYQAFVLPERPRLADPASTAAAGSGEQLLQ